MLLNKNIPVVGIILLLISIGVIPSSTSIAFYGDTTPPITVIYFNGTLGENNWYVSDVTVILNATGDESGVNVTYYKIDDGEWNIYNDTFIVSKDGIHIIYFYSVDNANNVEDVKTGGLAIDQTDPLCDFVYDIIGPERPLIEFTVLADDEMSGIDRVELYFNSELIGTRYESPYVFIVYPPCKVKVRGLIFPPSFSTDYVSFFGIYLRALVDWDGWWVPEAKVYDNAGNYAGSGCSPPSDELYILFLKRLSFTNNYTGWIGLFYIDASFKYEWEYYE